MYFIEIWQDKMFESDNEVNLQKQYIYNVTDAIFHPNLQAWWMPIIVMKI